MARRTIAVFLSCLLAGGTAPVPAHAGAGCGEPRPRREAARGAEPHALSPAEAGALLADLRRRLARLHRAPDTEITVPLWVHVITGDGQGATDQSVARQVTALNDAYGGRYGGADTGVVFRLMGVTRTENPAWFRDPLGYEAPMKRRLRRGGPETLNLYLAQLGDLVLGYSTYPHRYARDPELDGVVVDWRSLPGGTLPGFDRGFTAVHEIGHWLGLLHTFENGCAGGDGVADTPPEAYPAEGCPEHKDTCPAPGTDPIHNFMNYSHDRCMWEFTRGQAERIHQMWAVYRAPRA